MEISTVTSCSVLWPWFCTWTAKARSSLAGISAAVPSVSVWPEGWTLTWTIPLPWRPGAAASSSPPPPGCGRRSGSRSAAAASRCPRGSGSPGGAHVPEQLLLLETALDRGQEALRVDDVTGREVLHLRGDLVVGLRAPLVAEGGGQAARDRGQAVAPEGERLAQVRRGRPRARRAARSPRSGPRGESARTPIPFTVFCRSTGLPWPSRRSVKNWSLWRLDSVTSTLTSRV